METMNSAYGFINLGILFNIIYIIRNMKIAQ